MRRMRNDVYRMFSRNDFLSSYPQLPYSVQACSDGEQTVEDATLLRSNFLIDDQHSLFFCTMWKVGSQFWKAVMASSTNSSSIKKVPSTTNLTEENAMARIINYKKLIFVRDPWSRLWSAYVDKFVLYHPVYLNSYGRKIARIFRKSAKGRLEYLCGYSVTFQEFIDFIIYQYEHNERFNNHWKRYTDICSPCLIPYDFVGQMERIRPDFKRLEELFLEAGIHNLTKPNNKYTMDWMAYGKDMKLYPHLEEKYPRECHSVRYEYYSKWKSLKYQGFIDFSMKAPEWFKNIPDIPLSMMNISKYQNLRKRLNEAVITNLQKISDLKVMNRKFKKMVIAIDSLTRASVCTIESIYEQDFLLFGYDFKCTSRSQKIR